MVCNYAKLALITVFALMADAKKSREYGYKSKAGKDARDELKAPEDGAGFIADSFDSQDSKISQVDTGEYAKLLKTTKKRRKEQDFAKGMLSGILSALSDGDDPNQTITLERLADTFETISGEGFESEGNRAFERGLAFTEKMLFSEAGCREECHEDPSAEGCQNCCVSYMHAIDWNCGTENAAKCCTQWSADCFTANTEDNHEHSCKSCYGRRRRSYGSYQETALSMEHPPISDLSADEM